MSQTSARIIVFSGAGLSADSGISTFRSTNDGLWENHDVDVVANGYTWRRNFNTVREFYNGRRIGLSTVEPNPAHLMIAEWQKKYPTVILTQNIDDLLERAGCTDVIHLHGYLTQMKCVACGNIWDVGHTEWQADNRCPDHKCGSVKGVRPNVVFFNEPAPLYSKMYSTFRSITPDDCVVVIGTSGQVINVNDLLDNVKCLKILNNLDTSEYIDESNYDHVIMGAAATMSEKINQLVIEHMNGIS